MVERDTTGGRPIVHLFVGLHKTGSSAIRLMLDLHGSMLGRYGYHRPKAAWTRYINRFWNGGHNNVPWEICGHHPVLPEFGTLADLVAEIDARPDLQHIVFSEDLDYANGAQVQSLAEAFRRFDVRVIVFLRNQPDWLQSHYAEEHKWFGPEPAADWFLDRVRTDRRLHLDALCIRWARPFGNRISIRAYEDISGRVFDTFLECCGAPERMRVAFSERSLPLVNTSPDRNTLTLIQHAAAYARANGIRPEYLNAVVSPAMVTAAAAFPRSRQRVPMSAEARAELLALMTSCNRAVADAFGLTLGAEYWAVPPEREGDAGNDVSPAFLLEMCLDLGTRVGTRMRVLDDRAPARPSAIDALADQYFPWSLDVDDASRQRLHDLLESAHADEDGALYVERKGEATVAYEQRDGALTELARFTRPDWDAMVLALQREARLNRVSWNNLREGQLDFARRGRTTPLWVRHVPTSDGELVMIEAVGPSHGEAE